MQKMLSHQNAHLCMVHLKNGDVKLTHSPDTNTVPVGLGTRNEDSFFTLGKYLPQNYSPPESSAISARCITV